MISEQCSCGAAITVRRFWQLIDWRYTHYHEVGEPQIMVPPTGAGADTQIHPEAMFFEDRIGFTPNRAKLPV